MRVYMIQYPVDDGRGSSHAHEAFTSKAAALKRMRQIIKEDKTYEEGTQMLMDDDPKAYLRTIVVQNTADLLRFINNVLY